MTTLIILAIGVLIGWVSGETPMAKSVRDTARSTWNNF